MIRVEAVMLVNGRHEMVWRAIRCFEAQTYENKRLLIYDTGEEPFSILHGHKAISQFIYPSYDSSIGALRNSALAYCHPDSIIVHWDSDDWSGPDRIQQQVEALMAADVDAVGYNEMLFWREIEREAWLYRNPNPHYALGTSLCFWRESWLHNKFKENCGHEESEYLHWFSSLEISSGPANGNMIASIHAGNAHRLPYRRDLMLASEAQGGEWKRVPEWDEHCRESMAP